MTNDEMFRLVENIKWESIDKDNMEYDLVNPISCYQLDALKEVIAFAKLYFLFKD